MATRREELLKVLARRNQEKAITDPYSSITKFTSQGPTVEVFNPALEATKEASKDLMGTQNALDAFNLLFDKADTLIPAKENAKEAQLAGISRAFGRNAIGRLIGKGDEGAIAFQKMRKPYSTIISRGGLAEKGAISDRDREAILDALPGENDTALSRAEARGVGNKIISNRIRLYNEMYRALKRKKNQGVM